MYASPGFFRGLAVAVIGLSVAAPVAAPVAAGQPKTGNSAGDSAAPGCRIRALPVPAGTFSSQVNGGDRAARFLVGDANVDGRGTVVLIWNGDAVRELDTAPLAPYAAVMAADVNGTGVVVGNKTVDFGTFRSEAWVYRNGRFRMLPGLTATAETTATAINSRGDIVGVSYDAVNSGLRRAVIWPADRPGTVRELVPDTTTDPAAGVDVDDDGTVLGFLGSRPTETQRPYVWPASGRAFALTAPAGYGYAEGVAIRDGWVAGTALPLAGGNSVTVRWDLPTRTARFASTEHGVAYSVNRHGTIGANGALLYRDGRIRDLGPDARPVVLGDDGTAAGSIVGTAVRWIGC